jgi:hypothetical protein
MVRSVLVALALALVALVLAFVSCQSVEGGNEKEWGAPESIESLGSGAARPQIAFDPFDNAIAIWDQSDPATQEPGADPNDSDDLWTRRTNAQGRWSDPPMRLEQNEPGDSVFAQLGVDDDGDAVVAFLQDDGTRFVVWAVHYIGGEWQPARCIQGTSEDTECLGLEPAGDAWRPQIAVDAAGNAVVVWQQAGDETDPIEVWSNRFTKGSGWGDAESVANEVEDLLAPAVAMDENGNAIAVWEKLDRDRELSSIWSQRQTSGADWVEQQPVEINDDGNAFEPQIGVDQAGNAVAVWKQQREKDAPFYVWANRYSASTRKWDEAPQLIGPEDAGNAEAPRVTIDADGNALAVWVQTSGTLAGVWANRYEVGTGWGTEMPIGPVGLGPALLPQVAGNAVGEVVAIWVQFDGVQDSIWSSRFVPGQGWMTSESIEKDNETQAFEPQVAVDSDGNAMALWLTATGPIDFGWNLWANRLASRSPESDTK